MCCVVFSLHRSIKIPRDERRDSTANTLITSSRARERDTMESGGRACATQVATCKSPLQLLYWFVASPLARVAVAAAISLAPRLLLGFGIGIRILSQSTPASQQIWPNFSRCCFRGAARAAGAPAGERGVYGQKAQRTPTSEILRQLAGVWHAPTYQPPLLSTNHRERYLFDAYRPVCLR